jgi:hypothetical protein
LVERSNGSDRHRNSRRCARPIASAKTGRCMRPSATSVFTKPTSVVRYERYESATRKDVGGSEHQRWPPA